jgi:hypothetical protein
MMFLHDYSPNDFFHVYHFKDDICFRLNGSPNSHVYACVFQRRLCLRLLPIRARALTLCVMGGQQWLLGDACLPTRTRAPALRVTIYRLAGAGGSITNLLIGAIYIKYKHIYKRTLSVYNIFKIFFINSPTSYVLTCVTRNCSVLDLAPIRAQAPALCVMGGRQRLFGDALSLTRTQMPVTLRYGAWATRGW